MENALVREFQGHRIESVDVDVDPGRLASVFVEQPVRAINCACGWSAAGITMSRAREQHFGSMAEIRL